MHERIVWFAGQGDRDSTGQMKREMLSPRYTTRINKRSPRNKVSTPLSDSVSLSKTDLNTSILYIRRRCPTISANGRGHNADTRPLSAESDQSHNDGERDALTKTPPAEFDYIELTDRNKHSPHVF